MMTEEVPRSAPDHEDSFDIAGALVDLSISSSGGQAPSVFEVRNSAEPSAPVIEAAENPATDSTPLKSAVGQVAFITPQRPVHSPSKTPSDCLVILQDACNYHKFSRNVRQRELESIVERPERTRAAILGILNVKARLETLSQPNFDIKRCTTTGSLGDKAVEDVHGFLYPQELLAMSRTAADRLGKGELEIPESLPFGDLYLAPRSLDALNGCIGAVYEGMDALFSSPARDSLEATTVQGAYSRVHVCLRPPGHHAAETSPCGFCWINNVHVGIAYARHTYGIQRAAILDFDLHHGDGSQSIAWTLNETTPNAIGYYSLHDIYSYPCESGNIDKIREASVSISAHGHNIHNVILEPYRDLDDFDRLYEQKYTSIFRAAERYLAEGRTKGEKTMICISAGYDASEYESSSMQRHAVSVPTVFYERFTKDAIALADTYCGGKVFSVMEGGYGDRAITSASSAHVIGLAKCTNQDAKVSDSYTIDVMKSIEKHFPSKTRPGRKIARPDGIHDPWLLRLYQLHEEYLVPTSEPKMPLSEDQAMLLGLQKMTLRERKIRSTPSATPRTTRATPRSTPIRQERQLDSVRKPKNAQPLQVLPLEENPSSPIKAEQLKEDHVAAAVATTTPLVEQAGSSTSGPVTTTVFVTPPSKVSSIYDFIE